MVSTTYGTLVRGLRRLTNDTVNKEPSWRHRGSQLTTGYRPRTY
jgi:hydrogenase small subunit